jgi:hypothetical protein
MIYGTGDATRQVAIWLHGKRRSSFSGCSETVLSAAGLSWRIPAQQTKYDSQWVSTAAYGMLKRLDPTLAQRILIRYAHKIDTNIASATGNFMDANDFFDKAGVDRIYRR